MEVGQASCAAFALMGLVGCGGTTALIPSADGPTSLALTVTTRLPVLDELVITGGQIELERLSVFGDAAPDDTTQLPRVRFTLGSPPQTLVYEMATAALYSRLQTEIDHVALQGTWRGVPLEIHTNGDERTVDLRAPAEQLSAMSSAHFQLLIDGTQWLDAAMLDGAPRWNNDDIDVDEDNCPNVVDGIMVNVVASFAISDS